MTAHLLIVFYIFHNETSKIQTCNHFLCKVRENQSLDKYELEEYYVKKGPCQGNSDQMHLAKVCKAHHT